MLRFLMCMAVASSLSAQVAVKQEGNEKISVSIDGKPFTDFWIGPKTVKPILSPLRAASGVMVTRGYPMIANIPGETHDHPHHTGLWFTHGDVNGYNFWANEDSQEASGKGKGRVVLTHVDRASGGKKKGVIEATFEWRTPTGEDLLREDRVMTFYSDPQLRIIDFDITLSPQVPVTFGDTKEGMFALRLAPALEEDQPKDVAEPKRTGRILNAQNKTGEKNTWGKRSEWVDYSGVIDGQPVGITIFDHPANPRYPTYWHVRGYGLFAANIFGVHDFENDPSRDGSLTIRPGQPLRFRFRLLIHPGTPGLVALREFYDQYKAMK